MFPVASRFGARRATASGWRVSDTTSGCITISTSTSALLDATAVGKNKMREQGIRFKSGEIELAGTIALPDSDGPFPAVLLIPGSGQVDRNENHRKIRINAFYDISHYLAQNGIASLRCDKRGVGQSEGDYWTTGFHGRVQDALAALQYLKQQKNIHPEKIFILGHSEGSFIAIRLAGRGAEVAGVILLAGASQSGEAVLKWQAVRLPRD